MHQKNFIKEREVYSPGNDNFRLIYKCEHTAIGRQKSRSNLLFHLQNFQSFTYKCDVTCLTNQNQQYRQRNTALAM